MEDIEVQISQNSGNMTSGLMTIRKWPLAERRSRAFKRTFKIVGTVYACSLVGLFVHILLLVILPTLFLTTIAAVPMFMKFLGEEVTFSEVKGPCSYCHKGVKFRPYLDTKFGTEMTIQCPECGQTTKAFTTA